jgi:hypothetical protein
MSDIELLELAAKAVGYKLHIWGLSGEENVARLDTTPHTRWNPLADDGDALRLAVKLNIDVTMYHATQEVGAVQWRHNKVCDGIKFRCFEKYWTGDPCAAARRAIVRAAAEIGKSA